MSAVKFCDRCQKPFSEKQIGSQKINALEIIRDSQGRISSAQYEYDLCAHDAIRPQLPDMDEPTQTAIAPTVVNDQ